MVTVEASPFIGGAVSIEAAGTIYPDTAYVLCGDSIVATAVANLGYRFLKWTTTEDVTVSINPQYSFFSYDSCHLIAHFEYVEYTIVLLVSPSFSGHADTSGVYPLNTQFTAHAVANPCWKFVEWQNENEQTVWSLPDYPFTVTNDRTLTAIFEEATYDVEVQVNPLMPLSGTATIVGNGTDLACGDEVTILAEPEDLFEFKNWTHLADGTWFSDSAEYTFPVHQDYNLVANFVPMACTITLTPNPETGGLTEGSGPFYVGDVDTLKAFPNSNYIFHNWTDVETGDVIYIGNPQPHPVSGSAHFYANFLPKNYEIIVEPEPTGGGWVEGGGIFHHGQIDTVVAHANPNFVFVEWQEDEVWQSSDTAY
jgi:hypothetical protein